MVLLDLINYIKIVFLTTIAMLFFSNNIQRILIRKNIKEINIGIENYVNTDTPPSNF